MGLGLGKPAADAGMSAPVLTVDPPAAPDLNPVARHPCYDAQAHTRFGRVHVPVAPRCNLRCGYCLRRFDCPNENRPGVTATVLTPRQAITRIGEVVAREPRTTVVGISGPGDALANEATFQTLDLVRRAFPRLTRCVSTNGLLLLDRIDDLERVGVTALTVTVNAVDVATGARIYSHVRYRGRTHRGEEAFTLLANRQLEGLRQAALRGVTVKVNSVLIPGVNDHHLVEVARVVRRLGARVHNIIPLIPLGRFADLPAPSEADVAVARAACSTVISQFDGCLRCRADAAGVPGEECGLRPSAARAPARVGGASRKGASR